MKTLFVTLILTLLLAPGGEAHYLWVQPQNSGYLVARGLRPDTLYAYAPESIKEIRAFDAQGKAVQIKRLPETAQLRFQTTASPALVTVLAEWGHRVETPQGKEFLTKAEALAKGLTVEEAFFSIQTAKTLFAAGEVSTKPLGLPLEIVPLQDPLTLPAGQDLVVQVFFNGQPLANTRVRVEGVNELFNTDAHGKVSLALPARGYQLILASHKQPTPQRQDIDYLLYTTFLTFQR